MGPIISCEHLTHWYGKRKIYEDLNFEVAPGRIVGLLGKNGTGKTTTINILRGISKPAPAPAASLASPCNPFLR